MSYSSDPSIAFDYALPLFNGDVYFLFFFSPFPERLCKSRRPCHPKQHGSSLIIGPHARTKKKKKTKKLHILWRWCQGLICVMLVIFFSNKVWSTIRMVNRYEKGLPILFARPFKMKPPIIYPNPSLNLTPPLNVTRP